MTRACEFVGEEGIFAEILSINTASVIVIRKSQKPLSSLRCSIFSSYLVVKILRALKDAPTHLHDRGDRHQERDDPHDGANLIRKNGEENEGGRRGRERELSVLLSTSFPPFL